MPMRPPNLRAAMTEQLDAMIEELRLEGGAAHSLSRFGLPPDVIRGLTALMRARGLDPEQGEDVVRLLEQLREAWARGASQAA